MSRRALVLAAVDVLQSHFGWDDDTCKDTPRGRPHPDAGELFVGVCEGDERNTGHNSKDDRCGVTVLVSRRAPVAPNDRLSQEVINELSQGVERLANQIDAILHSNYTHMNLANVYLEDEAPASATVYGFSEPLFSLGLGLVEQKTGEWFAADPAERWAGVCVTVSLGEARRLQPISLQQ